MKKFLFLVARASRPCVEIKKLTGGTPVPLTMLVCWFCTIVTGFFPISARAWILETPFEFISEGDFDGDGKLDALVLDKQTGSARVAFQSAATNLSWQQPFASGIANAASIAIGKLTSTNWDSLVVTSPNANRVNKLEPGDTLSTNGISPVAIYPPGIGPNLVAALDAGGFGNTTLDDYFVTTTENPGSRRTLLRNVGTATSVLDDNSLSRDFSSPNVFEIKSGQGKRLGVISKTGKGFFTNPFQILDFSGGNVVSRLSVDVTASGSEFIAHRFATNNPLGQLLFYSPGNRFLTKFQVDEIAAGFSLSGSNRFSIGNNLQLIQPLPLANGARLLIYFGSSQTNLTNITIYNFDGTNAPQSVQSFSGNFSGAIAAGNGNIALLNSDGTGHSASFQMLLANGNNYTLGASGDLPKLNRFSGSANALLFDIEPFVNRSARPRQLKHHADWSTALQVTPTVRVTGQQFLNSSNGLGATSTRDFGAPISGVTTGLVNQYTPSISVFSGRDAVGEVEGDVRIMPPAGHYGEAQRLALSINPSAGWSIFYRTASSQSWNVYVSPFMVFSNATVEFYAKRVLDGTPTAIGSAAYTFSLPVSDLDSDHDGVPDFVENEKGLDPLGGADSDGDGFSDLEELARGTNPLSANSFPSTSAGLFTAFNRLVTPRPPNPAGTPTKTISGVSLRTFALGGAFLNEASTRTTNGTGITNPAALFMNLKPDPGTRLVVETTPEHFDLSVVTDRRVGRELLGLYSVPETNNFAVNYTFGSGSLATETANWIAAASNAVLSATNQTLAGLLTTERALVAGLFERFAANALITRGTNSATNATLFPFRGGDANRHSITANDLSNLEKYNGATTLGYSQRAVLNFLNLSVTNTNFVTLNNFASELWRISAAENNAHEGVYTLPFDELRRLLSGQSISAPYLAFKSIATNFYSAQSQAFTLLNSIPSRPRTNLNLVVVNNPGGPESIRLQTSGGTSVSLFNFDGSAFSFPPNFQLLPGAQAAVFAHTDLPADPGTLSLEVISLGLVVIPMPSPTDSDGNLLADKWEEFLFGGLGVDPFGDADADGYSNLQEMLEGTQPDDALITPGGPVYSLNEPSVTLVPDGTQIRFIFHWPPAFVNRFVFGLQASPKVDGAFSPVGASGLIGLGGDEYEIRVNFNGDENQFFRLTMQLGQ